MEDPGLGDDKNEIFLRFKILPDWQAESSRCLPKAMATYKKKHETRLSDYINPQLWPCSHLQLVYQPIEVIYNQPVTGVISSHLEVVTPK